MGKWIFVVTKQKAGKSVTQAREVYETRMREKFWGLAQRTPNRRNLVSGDQVVFYVGHPECVFAGTAVLASDSFELTKQQRQKYCWAGSAYETDFGVLLENVDMWEKPIRVQDLVSELVFIENEVAWGVYFQGGVRGVTEEDFATIIRGRGGPRIRVRGGKDIESAREFALESHLEEFLAANWDRVPWGRDLKLYETADSDGRQFPAGTWSIDFLAQDERNAALVVIELKRGQTSDATVGQVLRYMGWVRENLAEEGQQVEGLIVCRQMDEALRLAVAGLSGISVLTYRVDFELKKTEL